MMNWNDHKKRIRRFLRDPGANIWDDAVLLNLFNDEQREIQQKTDILEDVQALRVPPQFGMSYLHDWEWAFANDEQSKTYQALRYHQQSEIVYCNRWEIQAEWGIVDATATDEGWHFTHPWEAWYCAPPAQPVPIWYPENFHTAQFLAYDREIIPYQDKKSLMSDDMTWPTRSGKVQYYWRDDETENVFYLWPLPSTPVWGDVIGTDDGMVLFDDDDTVTAETGDIQAAPPYMFSQDDGLTTDIVDLDDNVLLVYDIQPADLSSPTDESDFHSYLTKYVEQGTLERAYSANTDGRIESLRDYWGLRKRVGLEIIKRFRGRRTVDRDYRLTTQGAPGRRARRGPRLPDEYPAI